MTAAKALLFVLTSRNPTVSEEKLDAWYDVKHAPSVATETGILSVSRFEANDSKGPTQLALYELSDQSAEKPIAYSPVPEDNDQDGTKIFDTVERRLYTFISDKRSPDYVSYLARCKDGAKKRDLLHVGLQPKQGGDVRERDFNDWYEEEHIPLHVYAPGWLRSSRWKLVDMRDSQLSSTEAGPGSNAALVPKYLVVHEFEDIKLVGSNEVFMHSLNTEWREEVMANIDKATEERRIWTLRKQSEIETSSDASGGQA